MAGYLFVHFIGEQKDGEQIYFSLSRDGLFWKDLNGGRPVLYSGIGEKGVRDPFLVRDPKREKYYLIATDLRIEAGKGWEAAARKGSLDVIVWESKDLVQWSDERSCRLGIPGAGCVWAPEAVYDRETERFFVFFASMVQLPGDEKPKQRIYGTYTEDFRNFTEPFVYIERQCHVIDTTIVDAGGIYYRFSKDETNSRILLEKSTALNGTYEKVPSRILDALEGVEGPECYLLPDGKTWCLIVDRFREGKGYLPLLSKDLASGEFCILSDCAYDMGVLQKRHGGVIKLEDDEYQRLLETYKDSGTGLDFNPVLQGLYADPDLAYFDGKLIGSRITGLRCEQKGTNGKAERSRKKGKKIMKYKMNHAPMGWNSYDYYDTTVNEEQVKANADFMAAHMKDAGWEYIIVDIQWYAKGAGSMREKYQYIPFAEAEMDDYGRLQPDVDRFPSSAGGKGFGPLAEYIHSLGLKFGIHIMRGIPRIAAHRHLPVFNTDVTADQIADPSSICGWNPDMYGVRKEVEGAQEYYDSIINMYAGWGVDFIKCDDICNTNLYRHNPYSAAHEAEMLHRAVEKSGRDIVLSLSPGPALIEKAWHYEKNANMWRITDDFWDKWELLFDMFDRCELWQNHVAEGSYPDCDMLPVGKLGKGFGKERDTNFTKDEQITMMTLWCVFGSPLMIGAELTLLDPWTLELLMKREVLKLTANTYVGRQVEKNSRYAVWSCRNEQTKELYLALFNFQDTEQEILCDLSEADQCADRSQGISRAREVWTGKMVKVDGGSLRDQVPAHGAGLYFLE